MSTYKTLIGVIFLTADGNKAQHTQCLQYMNMLPVEDHAQPPLWMSVHHPQQQFVHSCGNPVLICVVTLQHFMCAADQCTAIMWRMCKGGKANEEILVQH